MECKFIKHGLAIGYDQIAKPCCYWKVDNKWQQTHRVDRTDLINWHNHPDLINKNSQLSANQWPENCKECQHIESQGRADSGRGNSNKAYSHYQDGDITLEIRPGSVCNFACQTCWPAASSRVAQYHDRAGLIDIKQLDSTRIDDFGFLMPVASRIRDVVLLGGEPFYDKSCRSFLAWAQEHLTANLTMFTNGSEIDFEFLANYKGQITLVFSLDAVGKPAEYVRFGTVWDQVLSNYQRAKTLVNTRVNITCSIYNYSYIDSLIELLASDWPEVVSFGAPREEYLLASSIPTELRPDIISKLTSSIELLSKTDIESGQKSNAINALTSIVNNLKTQPWNQKNHQQWCDFVTAMDTVKNLNIRNYCVDVAKILDYIH